MKLLVLKKLVCAKEKEYCLIKAPSQLCKGHEHRVMG